MEKNKNNGGIGFTGMLTIVFIALKLMNFITWSWVWIVSPIWITMLLAIVIVTLTSVILK